MLNSYLTSFDRARRISAFERSPLLDREYYARQAKTRFQSDREAATHFHDIGIAEGLSITPLFSDEWYRYNSGRVGEPPCFLSFFFGAEPLNTTSPLFDARRFVEQRAVAGLSLPRNSRDALELFLKEASASTALPTHQWAIGEQDWGPARALALDSAERINERDHFTRARLTSQWDAQPETLARPSSTQANSLVSIVMPVRNRASIVAGAIASVLTQTHQHWELVIVDDGSTDETADVIRRFSTNDSRIRLLSQPQAGVCAARNNGLDHTSGEFVAFIDSDNEWVPDFIEMSLPAFNDEVVVAAHAAVEMIDDHGARTFLAIDGGYEDLLNGGNFIDLNTLIARRDALIRIGGFDNSLRRWVDFDLAIRLSLIGELRFIRSVGVAYSHRNDVTRISNSEPNGWEQVVLSKYLLDWNAVQQSAKHRRSDLISIVLLSYADWRMTVEAVQSILATANTVTFELIVLDNGSPRPVREILSAALAGDDRVRLVSLPRNTNFALGSNLAFAETVGEFVVFVNDDVIVESGWLQGLRDGMREDASLSGAQSIVLNSLGEVESAGLTIDATTGLPVNRTDAESDGAAIRALSGISCIYRAEDFAQARGFDPLYSNGFEDADLGLRLAGSENTTPQFAVLQNSRLTHFGVFSPGRFAQEAQNKRLFLDRWGAPLQR